MTMVQMLYAIVFRFRVLSFLFCLILWSTVQGLYSRTFLHLNSNVVTENKNSQEAQV